MLQAHSNNSTELNDRTLWFDGDSTVSAKNIIDSITKGGNIDSLFVDSLTDDIMQYNTLVEKSERISVKTELKELNFDWNIPEEFKKLDIVDHVSILLNAKDGNKPDIADREQRIKEELERFEQLELFPTLKALIYIVNILEKESIVWGVGRGSSVSSYVLYIIGIHDIDSYYYNLNIEEFLR